MNGWNRINPLDINNCKYDIRIYDRALSADQIKASPAKPPAVGLVAHWAFEGDGGDDSGCGNDAVELSGAKYIEGKVGKALRLTGRGRMVVPWKGAIDVDPTSWLWSNLRRDFGAILSELERFQGSVDEAEASALPAPS